MFGFQNEDWKPWTTFDGTPVLVPGGFNTQPEPNGDILMYPEGDRSVPPSGRMPKGGFYFDTIVRQEPIDDEKLNVEDNLEEFGPISDDDARSTSPARPSGCGSESDRAILANFGGTAFGDIALVPAPWLKNPKGIRDVAEWYMSTVSPLRLRLRGLPPAVRDRPGEPGEDLRGRGRPGVGGVHHRHRFRHAERAVHQPGQPTASSISRSTAA